MERPYTDKDLIAMANIIWRYQDLVVENPIPMGSLEHLAETTEFEIEISHDSNQEISNCGFYIDRFTNQYNGSFSPLKDYELLLWLANNYPGFGLSIRQVYEVTGQIEGADGIRIIDFDRNERTDIFSGANMEILSGDAVGEIASIASYNPDTQLFLLNNDFSANVTGASYRITIDQEKFFKTGQGSSYDSAIPLVYKGGVIERLDQTSVFLKLRIPKFARSAGNFLFDLKMEFTSLEEE